MTEIPRISRPADDALAAAGLTTLEQVARTPRKEVAALHGMGPKGVRILAEAIERAKLGPWRP
jgi:predicted flap endonuclease-1-like 5' DNA nuclease